MNSYDDSIEGYVYRKKIKLNKKLNEDKKPVRKKEEPDGEKLKLIIEKINKGIEVDGDRYSSVDEIKLAIDNLKKTRRKIRSEAMDHTNISRRCIELNKSYDEVINIYQEEVDQIDIKIHNIKEAVKPLVL